MQSFIIHEDDIIVKEIEKNIYPVYQAIIDIHNSNLDKDEYQYKIIKYEALIRSKYNDKTLFPHHIIIPNYTDNSEFYFKEIDQEAFKTNIKPIFTKELFRKIIQDINEYKIHVSFNISVSDLENNDLYNFIINSTKNNNIGEYITFEFIEEEEVLTHKDLVKKFINEVHELKAKVALDDFGKGYATIGPLLEFDFDIIKFDKVLIENFLEDHVKYYLLNTLIDMFHKVDKDVVAEYIETVDEFNALKYINCQYGQGYCIAKPQPLENYLNKKIDRSCKRRKKD